MPKYDVYLPITGTALVTLSADSEEDAIDAALITEIGPKHFEEWGVERRIVQGNVFLGIRNEAEALESAD